MQAVIMAGGKGTRLAEVTKDIPKPMVPIAGKALLEYQIETLRECGVKRIILIVGYLGDVIRNHFGNGNGFGVDISYYTEETPLGTAGALSKIKEKLDQSFFLVFGDLFININYNRLFQFHQAKHAEITLFAHPNSHPYDSDIIITDEQDRVIGWSYKKEIRYTDYRNLVNAGIYVMNKTVADRIETIQSAKGEDKVDLEKEVIIPAISTVPFYAYHSTEYVKDIGTPDRMQKVTADFLHGICEKRNLKHKQKCIFLNRDGTIIKRVESLKTVEQVELEPDAADAIRQINESEYLAVVIVDQSAFAEGECIQDGINLIHNRMYTLLGREGAYVDALFYCPLHPDQNADIWKKAEDELSADLSLSWFIGDNETDMQTGLSTGLHTVLLRSDTPQKDKYNAISESVIADNLPDAVKKIFSGIITSK